MVQFTKGTTEDTIDVMMEKSLEIEGVEDIRELDQDVLEVCRFTINLDSML